MPRRYIDLSMTLENDVISDPPFLAPKIDYEVHADTRHELEQFFPGADIDGIIGGDVHVNRCRRCIAEKAVLVVAVCAVFQKEAGEAESHRGFTDALRACEDERVRESAVIVKIQQSLFDRLMAEQFHRFAWRKQRGDGGGIIPAFVFDQFLIIYKIIKHF